MTYWDESDVALQAQRRAARAAYRRDLSRTYTESTTGTVRKGGTTFVGPEVAASLATLRRTRAAVGPGVSLRCVAPTSKPAKPTKKAHSQKVRQGWGRGATLKTKPGALAKAQLSKTPHVRLDLPSKPPAVVAVGEWAPLWNGVPPQVVAVYIRGRFSGRYVANNGAFQRQ
jgi:hypothetical protein